MSTGVRDATGAPRRVDQARPPVGSPRPRYRDALRQLRSAQKPNKRGPAYTVRVNRRVGRVLAAAAHVRGLTPNTLTCISASFTFAGVAVLAATTPSGVGGLTVAALLLLGFALDSADGQVARLRGGGSVSGEWLDHTLDAIKIPALHLAVAVSFYRWGEMHEGWLLVPLGHVIIGAALFFTLTFTEQLLHRALAGNPDAGPGPRPLLRSLLMLPTDYGVLCWVFVLLFAPHLFLAVYAAMLAAGVLHLARLLTKSYSDLRAAERRSA